jgi:hypothetical protein
MPDGNWQRLTGKARQENLAILAPQKTVLVSSLLVDFLTVIKGMR